MRLAKLIKKTSWESVRTSISKFFNGEDEIDLGAFKVFFETLKYHTTPAISNISLQIITKINPVNEEKVYQLSGINLGPKRNRRELKKVLEKEYNSWDKWLGMEIDDKTLEEISVIEIIGVCMYAMHVIRKQPEIILNQLENFIDLVGENKKIPKEEKIGDLIFL